MKIFYTPSRTAINPFNYQECSIKPAVSTLPGVSRTAVNPLLIADNDQKPLSIQKATHRSLTPLFHIDEKPFCLLTNQRDRKGFCPLSAPSCPPHAGFLPVWQEANSPCHDSLFRGFLEFLPFLPLFPISINIITDSLMKNSIVVIQISSIPIAIIKAH